jgi:hypothetical protein
MTGYRIGAAILLQAPSEIQALEEADVQPEIVSGGDISQVEIGILPPEGRFVSQAEADLDLFGPLTGFDFNGFDYNMWPTSVPGRLDPGSSSFQIG